MYKTMVATNIKLLLRKSITVSIKLRRNQRRLHCLEWVVFLVLYYCPWQYILTG